MPSSWWPVSYTHLDVYKRQGQTSTAVLLDGELTVGYSGSVLSASQIIRAKNDGFYLLTDLSLIHISLPPCWATASLTGMWP